MVSDMLTAIYGASYSNALSTSMYTVTTINAVITITFNVNSSRSA